MIPPHAILTPFWDWVKAHKSVFGAFISAGLLAVVPDTWKPLVTAIGTLFASHAGSQVGTSSAVAAHLKRRGLN